MTLFNLFQIIEKGGSGSGNKGHSGIPGKRGGSAPKNNLVLPEYSSIDNVPVSENFLGSKAGFITSDNRVVGVKKDHTEEFKKIVNEDEKIALEKYGYNKSSSPPDLEDMFNALNNGLIRVRKSPKRNHLYVQTGIGDTKNLRRLQDLINSGKMSGDTISWDNHLANKVGEWKMSEFLAANKVENRRGEISLKSKNK